MNICSPDLFQNELTIITDVPRSNDYPEKLIKNGNNLLASLSKVTVDQKFVLDVSTQGG